MEDKNRNIIVILLMIICLLLGCVISKTILSDNSKCLEIKTVKKDKPKKKNKQVKVQNTLDNKEENNNTNYWNYDNTDMMVETMLGMLKGDCSDKNNFFITSNTNFNNMSNDVKAEIAMFNISDRYSNKMEDKIKRTFGNNKSFDLPEKLNTKHLFATYELVDGEYKEVADGGGCTGFKDYFNSQIIEKKYYENKIVFKVNIGYLVRDNAPKDGENIDIDNELHSTLYNNYNKKRIIERNIYHKNEEEIFNKLLYSDKMDYILFTFIKEEQVYIFDKAELIER